MLIAISNSKYSKVVSTVLAALIFFNNVIFPTKALALTGGPSQTEFSSFDPAGASEMVNLFTGDFSYNIPLMDVDGYPVNIAYHAAPTMDQEASWVGLGWNINAGAINRGMRGLPDDFNGDPVHRDINIKDYKAWGVSVGYFGELVGGGIPFSGSSSAGVGVVHTNYAGYGLELSNNNSFGVSAGKHTQGGLTAGLGVKMSSQDGTDIYPQLGLSAKMNGDNRTTSVGVNIGCAINSREGLKSIYGGYSISSQKKGAESNADKKAVKNTTDDIKTPGLGFGSSASIPGSSQGYMPKAIASMKSSAFNYDIKVGVNGCVYAQGGYISGYVAKHKLNDADKDRDYNAYGYLYASNGSDDALYDFNREKEGMIYPELPNMPISNFTYDMFSASAQGLNYAFRPYRNDIGVLRDNSTFDDSYSIGIGAEIMVSTDVNIGLNTNILFSEGKSGRWIGNNDMNQLVDFYHQANNSDIEEAYFKVAGENTDDDQSFINTINANLSGTLNDEPVYVDLDKVSDVKYKATDKLVNKSSQIVVLNPSNKNKTKRATRNNLVSYLNAYEASKFGLNKKIQSYPALTTSNFNPAQFDNVVLRTSIQGTEGLGELVNPTSTFARDGVYCGNRTHHLSEMTVTQTNGSRYVYGIPLYNREQVDAMFNVGLDGTDNSSITDGLALYSATDPTLFNGKGIDNFMERRTIKDYSHGFLLTSIISSDYVDRTDNGPSADDYGDYTKFNYSKVTGDGSEYRWRIPFASNKANFNQGLLADKKDNKGSYLYGKKDLWYNQSIETKNYVAFFILNNPSTEGRKDAYPVAGEDGGISSYTTARYLKEIRLYAKKDFTHGGIANAKPIKVVHFEYDYSLCPGVPNNVAGGGKLTLKQIWFSYGNSQKGKLSPYNFEYGDLDHNGVIEANYPYNPAALDRWGSYKPNSASVNNNLDFPYVKQDESDLINLNKYAAAWSLSQVITPAGSSIKVNYEADDYAYVQDKNAAQMFKIIGCGASTAFSGNTNLYGSEYIYVDLTSAGSAGILASSTTPDQEFNNKFMRGLSKLYFRVKMDMDGKGAYEFVPGYADVVSSGACTSPTSGDLYYVNSIAYLKNAYIKIDTYGINDKNSGTPFINGIVKAGMQMGRMYLPQIVFPGSQPASTGVSAVQGLITTLKDAKSLLKGINKALYNRGIAKTFDDSASVVRLYNPNGFKKGGGHRVSQITINDAWNSISGEADSEYGQIYDYKTTEGTVMSSGVASYEPLQGGDENSMRHPIEFAINKTFAPNDEYFQEEPMGESFFPDPLVGYSKVAVKNLPHANVTKHATGRTEYEFMTARDFPVITDRTQLLKQRVKPNLIKSILKFGATDKLYLSQGYLIKTNDMHGKQKSQKIFAEGSNAPISGVVYHYKSQSNQLDNKVSVLNNKTNTITTKNLGKTTDFYTDSRNSENDTYTTGVSVNFQSATCTNYVPLVFVWPSFGHENREFNSIGTTKLVQQYGLVDYVEAFENGSTVKTENLLYDDVTGEVLLTKTYNDFNDPIYNLKYNAYWAYQDMGAAFANTSIRFDANTINASGKIINYASFFRPGDEVAVFDNVRAISDPTNAYIKAWVIEDKVGNSGYYLVDINGKSLTLDPTFFINLLGIKGDLKILRSGRRNMQTAPMASILSQLNPVAAGNINIGTSGILNSSAVEYSDKWNLLVGDKKGDNDCVCAPSPTASAFLNAIQSAINILQVHKPTTPQPVVVFNKIGAATATFPDPNQSPFIQALNWTGCNSATAATKNIVITATLPSPTLISGSLYNHKLILTYVGQGLGCAGQTTCPIELNITRPLGTDSLPNIWATDVPSIIIGNVSTPTNCQSSFSFPFSVGGLAKIEESSFIPIQGTGTSCFPLVTCTQNNVIAKCGKDVGDVVNPYVENIRGNWRVKKSYSYLTDRTQQNTGAPSMNGNIRADGTYNNFKPFWKYSSTGFNWQPVYTYNSGSFDNWIKNNEVDKINEYGNVLQARDVLGRASASLYGYNHTLPLAAANNAYYNQLAFDGFEDYDYIRNDCSASLLGNTPSTNPSGYIEHFNYYIHKSLRTTNESHTGRYSIKVPVGNALSVSRKLTNPNPTSSPDDVEYHIKQIDNYGLFGPYYGYPTAQKFVLSVWAKENVVTPSNSTNAVLTYPGAAVVVTLNGITVNVFNPKVSAIVNGWQKLEYEFTVPANTPNANSPATFGSIIVTLKNLGANDMYYDDIRIHPFNSSMKSMVYDPYSLRLMAELDDRNFATFYEYDEEGTLVRVKKETEKGIYTIKESRSGLKK